MFAQLSMVTTVTDSLEEEVSTAIIMVRILNVDDTSDGFWVRPKLEGHSLKIQIHTGSKASLMSYICRRFLKHLAHQPSDTVLKRLHWILRAYERDSRGDCSMQ